jgi:Uri superfamily endonuclease
MPDYQKGKIYKLWSPQGNEIYIGSTVNSLAKRLGHHKTDSRCNSKYLFENYDVVKIELIEEYPCNNKMELLG